MTRSTTGRAMGNMGMGNMGMSGMMPGMMMDPMMMMGSMMGNMSSMMPQMMDTMGMGPVGMMMPRCTMKMDKTEQGMSCTCTCDDRTSAMMMQNLCNMMAGGMCSMCCISNGIMICCCNLMMGMCKFEMTDMGMTMTCTSGDTNSVKMIHACCDCMTACVAMPGCCCCMMMNGMPVCCSVILHETAHQLRGPLKASTDQTVEARERKPPVDPVLRSAASEETPALRDPPDSTNAREEPILPPSWTSANRRRSFLIERQLDGELSPSEEEELTQLEEQMDRYVEARYPLPIGVLDSLRQAVRDAELRATQGQ